MELHKFKVDGIKDFAPGAKVYLDDKPIHAKGYTLEHYAGELAHLTLEMDVRADAEYDNLELRIEQPSEAEYRRGLRETRKILCDLYGILEDISENGEEKDLKGLRKLYKYFETHPLAKDTVRMWGNIFSEEKNEQQAEVLCVLNNGETDRPVQVLGKSADGSLYYTCYVASWMDEEKRIPEAWYNMRFITLDDADDYIMEFYPEEYDRIKPILDAEREKSAKNKKE